MGSSEISASLDRESLTKKHKWCYNSSACGVEGFLLPNNSSTTSTVTFIYFCGKGIKTGEGFNYW
jgi:hypothetical protein